LYFSKPTAIKKAMMLYFHGIGEDLGNLNYEISTLGEMLEVDVLAVEYPGFGLNFHSGVSTEA